MTDRNEGGGPLPAAALAAVIAALTRLLGNEVALLKAEAARAASDTRRAIGLFAVAVVLGLVALNALAGAAVLGLMAAGLHPAWAMLAVGVGLLALALGYAQAARWRLRRENLSPWRSRRSMQRSLSMLGGESEKAPDHADQ